MTEQPLALQWLCFLRDHGADLKLSKEARVLASVLPTYGQGKKILATMVTLSKVTGMKRETVRNARQELEDKGLLEDITGVPKAQKQERTYRLTLPGYVTPDPVEVVPEGTTRGPSKDHPVVPERTTPGPQEDHNIKLVDQAGESSRTSTSRALPVDGDGHGAIAKEDQRHDEAPSASADATASAADNHEIDWTGNDPDEHGRTSRDYLASWIGVPVASIGAPLWRWLGGLGLVDEKTVTDALYDAASKASDKPSPVGYFQTILPGYLARYHAEHEAQVAAERAEAEAQAAEERAERELWDSTEADRAKILATITDHAPVRVRPLAGARLQSWYEPGCVTIWHHPEFDAVFAGSSAKRPGPDWESRYMCKAAWEAIKDQGVIPLRAA